MVFARLSRFSLLVVVLSFCSGCSHITIYPWYKTDTTHMQTPPVLRQEVMAAAGVSAREADLGPEYFLPFNPASYHIAQGDVMEISVFGHPDTVVDELPVAPDGKIYYFFLDGIPAVGLTPNELSTVIEAQLEDLFTQPEVSVIPKLMAENRFTVLGKVESPGEYMLTSAMTLREALAEAGGLAQAGYGGSSLGAASLDASFIVRNGEKLPIDFRRLMTEEGSGQDIYVRPGDYIYVASALKKWVYRIGSVFEEKPVPFRDGMTLTAALADPSGIRGGWTQDANIDQVLVLRGTLEDPEVTVVNLAAILAGEANDVYLTPGDIVYVPEKRFLWLKNAVTLAVEIFVRGFAGRAGEHIGDEYLWRRGE